MIEILSLALKFVLFVVTVVWVGRKPTVSKTAVMICIVAVVLVGLDLVSAMLEGMTVYGGLATYYTDIIDSAGDQAETVYGAVLSSSDMASVKSQLASLKDLVPVFAGCWFAMDVIAAAFDVFIALVIAWAFAKITKRNQGWGAFSAVDLPISMMGILIVGLLVFALSHVPGLPQASLIGLVSYNILLISAIPILVQGCAAGKGVMNNVHLNGVWQVVIAIGLLFLGVLVFIVAILGVIDFWANLRKLPRDDEEPAQ